jgi:hypothetical protein
MFNIIIIVIIIITATGTKTLLPGKSMFAAQPVSAATAKWP